MAYRLFQANPNNYFVLQYWLEDYAYKAYKQPPGFIDWWGVEKNIHHEFHRDDVVFLWKSAFEPPDHPEYAHSHLYFKWKQTQGWVNKGRGIYGVGQIVGDAVWQEYKADDLKRFEQYYVDRKKAMGKQWWVPFKYFEQPILKSKSRELLVDPLLWNGDLEKDERLVNLQHDFDPAGRNGQGIKALVLDTDEGEILWKRVFGEALPPPTKK